MTNNEWQRISPGFDTTREAYEHQGATVDRIIARNTPTDDEREALVARLEDEVAYRVRTAVALHKGGHDIEAQVTEGRASVRKIASGFRRSEVPEPSAEHQEHADARRAETMTLLSHTPTDADEVISEREALMKLTDVACGPRADERYADGWSGARQEIRLRIAALPGFRRSEVPEPSVEHQKHADARRAETMTLLSHSEPQGEPSDALFREIEERVYAEYQGIAGLAVALVRAGYEAGLNARSRHRKDT